MSTKPVLKTFSKSAFEICLKNSIFIYFPYGIDAFRSDNGILTCAQTLHYMYGKVPINTW